MLGWKVRRAGGLGLALWMSAVLAASGCGPSSGTIDDLKAAAGAGQGGPPSGSKDLSDQDRDGDVDLDDVAVFARNKLEVDYTVVDWKSWIESDSSRWAKHYSRLVAFIASYFGLEPGVDPLAIENTLTSPSRMARGPDGQVFVSDPSVGSVFRLGRDLLPEAEYKGFESPVGVAVDGNGNLFVADDARDVVEKVDARGTVVATLGAGLVRKPMDLAVDSGGLLYVADAEASVVWIFRTSDGSHAGTVRRGGLGTPVAVEIASRTDAAGAAVEELFVVDRASYVVRVYDLLGEPKRSFGGLPKKSGGMMGGTYAMDGYFVAPQSLFVASDGLLHVLDMYQMRVQVLDPVTGAFQSAYGKAGTGTGEYRVPVDILADGGGGVLVSDPEMRRVEVIR